MLFSLLLSPMLSSLAWALFIASQASAGQALFIALGQKTIPQGASCPSRGKGCGWLQVFGAVLYFS